MIATTLLSHSAEKNHANCREVKLRARVQILIN